jgi:hypothetical protein
MSLLLLLAAAASPIPSHLTTPWLEFSREPANASARTEIELGTIGFDPRRKQLELWARRTVRDRSGEHVAWADSRTCPEMRAILARLRNVPVPRFAPLGVSAGPQLTVDGIGYSIRTYSDEGFLEAETNIGTPLAGWIEQSLDRLEGCWGSGVPPRIETQ